MIGIRFVGHRYHTEIVERIADEADKNRVNPALVLAIAERESGLDPNAIGDQGRSFGLMQLYIEGAGAEYKDDPYKLLDIETNIRVGCTYLKECIKAFPGSITRAIAAYNAGIKGVQVYGIKNINYVLDVMDNYWQWMLSRHHIL